MLFNGPHWPGMIAARAASIGGAPEGCGLQSRAVDREAIKQLLEAVASGDRRPEEALESLAALPFVDRGYARVDTHRSLRLGLPEVIFGQGKTDAQVAGIAQTLAEKSQRVLVTRATESAAAAVGEVLEGAEWHETARCISYDSEGCSPLPKEGK